MKPSGLLRLAEGPAEEDLLGLLGLRLREARAGRGMTRKLLAMQSQVSERYLAQLEAGQANPSVLVLQKLADALGLPIVSLLHEAPVGSEQTMLLLRLLRGHSEGQLRELRTRLAAELGRADDHRRSRIALTGLRGAGKSTLGKRLAKKLACLKYSCSTGRPATGVWNDAVSKKSLKAKRGASSQPAAAS